MLNSLPRSSQLTLYRQFLQSPYLFMCVSLWFSSKDEPLGQDASQCLGGSLVSSLHRLKDIDNHGKQLTSVIIMTLR